MINDLGESLEQILELVFRSEIWSFEFNLLFCAAFIAGALAGRGVFALFKVKIGIVRTALGLLLVLMSLLAAYAWVDVLAVPRVTHSGVAKWLPYLGMVVGGLCALWLFGKLLWQKGVILSLVVFAMSVFVGLCFALVVDSIYDMVIYVQSEMDGRQEGADVQFENLKTVVLPDS